MIADEPCTIRQFDKSDGAAASRQEFDLVLFWSLDRFSREGVLETLQHLQRLTSFGVGLKSFTEQYLDSCGVFRDAVLSIPATIAKQERIRLGERTLAGSSSLVAQEALRDFLENHRPPTVFPRPLASSARPARASDQPGFGFESQSRVELYGDPPKPDPDYGGIWENRRDQPADDPVHIYTGTCRTPGTLALRDKENDVDLRGLAKIRWRIR
jgi:hypothetical protein